MKIEDYIKIAEAEKQIDGVSLLKTERLEYKTKTMPDGYQELVRWSFSDGTVVHFENQTDTEPGWRGHCRYWRFEVIGQKVSNDSSVGLVDKTQNF